MATFKTNAEDYIMKHKWHKEIKAWADGAEIEIRFSNRKEHCDGWTLMVADCWNDDEFEFRIKSQPKEPQYMYVYEDLNDATLDFDLRSPKILRHLDYAKCIGKIKLEVDDD